ncbi:MAG: XRE family transcriptional regulator [Thermomicrobiales bacterium]
MALRATQTPDISHEQDAWADDLLDRVHARTIRASTSEMAAFLQDLVGQKLTAVMAGIDDPKAVGKWARGERQPRGDAARRLRDAFQVATLLTLGESAETAQVWLMGMNPHLDDQAPATVFAEYPDGGARAMRAARAFLAHG